jgi:RNA polymerase sigma-70 factor, ECF subfamily
MALFHTRSASISLSAPDEFARFYEQNHLSVFRYAMALCAGDQGEAEEITAEAFFHAWEKRQQFSGSAPAALGWVITIARHLLIDRRRAQTSRPVEAELDGEAPDTRGQIEELLVDAEQTAEVLAALRSLPVPQAELLTLRYVLGWQVKAIAAHQGLPENTVSVYLRRALASLQRKLAPQAAIPRRAV